MLLKTAVVLLDVDIYFVMLRELQDVIIDYVTPYKMNSNLYGVRL